MSGKKNTKKGLRLNISDRLTDKDIQRLIQIAKLEPQARDCESHYEGCSCNRSERLKEVRDLKLRIYELEDQLADAAQLIDRMKEVREALKIGRFYVVRRLGICIDEHGSGSSVVGNIRSDLQAITKVLKWGIGEVDRDLREAIKEARKNRKSDGSRQNEGGEEPPRAAES